MRRQLDSLDSCFTGGHGRLRFDNLRIPASDVLGEIGKGFRYAQVRLAPAQLTTACAGWAPRVAPTTSPATMRAPATPSGKPLGEHQGVGFMLADNMMDLHVVRLAVWHCAWVLDQGRRANVDSSMAKVISAEALWRVVDRCVQVLGGRGVTGDTVVERIFRDIRPFRI
ncbi:acyl-CoA dehydrogenase family protein [Pseudomonas aeruginosa]